MYAMKEVQEQEITADGISGCPVSWFKVLLLGGTPTSSCSIDFLSYMSWLNPKNRKVDANLAAFVWWHTKFEKVICIKCLVVGIYHDVELILMM